MSCHGDGLERRVSEYIGREMLRTELLDRRKRRRPKRKRIYSWLVLQRKKPKTAWNSKKIDPLWRPVKRKAKKRVARLQD